MTVIPLPGGWVVVRALIGHDENAIDAVDLPTALDLLDRLLLDRVGALVGHNQAGKLTVTARDRLLAAVYRQIFGDLIRSTMRCLFCGELFDLSFGLSQLVEAQPVIDTSALPRADAVYQTETGWHFRLVTGDDEMAVIGLSNQSARRALLERCSQMSDAPDDQTLDQIEQAMEQIAPVLNVELSATCAECGREQQIRFDMQTFLLSRLIKDKARLAADVHTLAVTYHWGLNEILSLKRSERLQYLALIEADARRTAARSSGGRRRMGA